MTNVTLEVVIVNNVWKNEVEEGIYHRRNAKHRQDAQWQYVWLPVPVDELAHSYHSLLWLSNDKQERLPGTYQ